MQKKYQTKDFVGALSIEEFESLKIPQNFTYGAKALRQTLQLTS